MDGNDAEGPRPRALTEEHRARLAALLATDGLARAAELLVADVEDAGRAYWRGRDRQPRPGALAPPSSRSRTLEGWAAALEGGRAQVADLTAGRIERAAALGVSLREAGLLPRGGPRAMTRGGLADLLRELAEAVRDEAPARWDGPFEALLHALVVAWRRRTGREAWVGRDHRTGDEDSPFRRFLVGAVAAVDRDAVRGRVRLACAIARFRRDERELFEPDDGPDSIA